MTNSEDLVQMMDRASKGGLHSYNAAFKKLGPRERVVLLQNQRNLCQQELDALREKRRNAIVQDGGLPDAETRAECAQLEQDLQDYDVAIATHTQQAADQDAAERKAADEAAAAAKVEHDAARLQARNTAGHKLDQALAAAEEAYQAYLSEIQDGPQLLKKRREHLLRAAVHQSALGLARALRVAPLAQPHWRLLGGVNL